MFENVTIENGGIDWSHEGNIYWQHRVHRTESCNVVLHGNSAFHAKNVTIVGNQRFEVPDGHVLSVEQGASPTEVITKLSPLDEEASWKWKYHLEGSSIRCRLQH